MKQFDQLETERTLMRKLTADDAENFYALNLDPEVLQYTGDKAFEHVASAREFLMRYDQYQKYGVGRLAVINKSTSRFMGWCGLKYSEEKKEYDIGFRFLKHHWNQGYASETAKKCLSFAFEELLLNKIVGRAMKANKSSIRVLEKIGMHYKAPFDFDGNEGLIYEASNQTKH